MTFEARYYSPDGRVGEWDTAEYEYSQTEEDDTCPHLSVSTQNLPACLEGVQALRHNYVQHVSTDRLVYKKQGFMQDKMIASHT